MSDGAIKEEDPPELFFPGNKQLCTEELFFFLRDFKKLMDFFFFIINLATTADQVRSHASKVLAETAKDDNEREMYSKKSGEIVFDKLKNFRTLNSRNLTTNTVDTFLWFFSSIIKACINKNPVLLKSSESITVEEVLDFDRKTDLIDYLIDRKINSLSYGGIRQMERFLSDRLGVDAFKNDESRDLLGIFVEVRNIYIHNRGIVNRLFLSRVIKHFHFEFVEDERFHVDFDDFSILANNSIKVAVDIDERLAKKFRLQRFRYGTWLKKKNLN